MKFQSPYIRFVTRTPGLETQPVGVLLGEGEGVEESVCVGVGVSVDVWVGDGVLLCAYQLSLFHK